MRVGATTRSEPPIRRFDRPATGVPASKRSAPPTAQRASAGRIATAIALLFVLALGAAALGPLGRWRAARALARAEQRLQTAPPQQVADQVHELCADAQRRPDVLARLLASPREAVAQAAAREVEAALIQIEMTSDAAGAQALAGALGRALPTYGPSSRAVARAMAVRLLTLAGQGDGALLDACDAILRRTDVAPPRIETPYDAPALAEASPRAASQSDLDQPWPELMHLPGGGLATAQVDVPALPRSAVDSPRDDAPMAAPAGPLASEPGHANEPGRLPKTPPPRALRGDGEVEMRLIDPHSEPRDEPPREPPPLSQTPRPRAAGGSPVEGSIVPIRAETATTRTRPAAWSEQTEGQLLDALREGDPPAEIQAELRRRGFDDRQLELVDGLTSPQVADRLEWTLGLPSYPGIEPAPWLVWLCDDPDAEVRGSALRLLAATDADQARPILQRVSRSDPDPQLRQQAEELLAGLESAER